MIRPLQAKKTQPGATICINSTILLLCQRALCFPRIPWGRERRAGPGPDSVLQRGRPLCPRAQCASVWEVSGPPTPLTTPAAESDPAGAGCRTNRDGPRTHPFTSLILQYTALLRGPMPGPSTGPHPLMGSPPPSRNVIGPPSYHGCPRSRRCVVPTLVVGGLGTPSVTPPTRTDPRGERKPN